ncbi:hypothetical protein DKX38_018668 [Salix brachista]|uniref:Uncharacterized protein n=1 Tax=Salix brachista TaxID=2182728 RepID=A0A5N5KPF5_9ROSI|nr:hypothetical protein DKX38_018668 [Salix brachista]
MPGPGPHLMYAMTSGLALTTLTSGRFSPHHTLIYTVNAFFGPDIGSFSEWLGSILGSSLQLLGSSLADYIHDPFYYILILGLPLCVLYTWVSKILLQRKLLDSASGVPLSRRQCFLLVSAGSFSHFFLDHLFECEILPNDPLKVYQNPGNIFNVVTRHSKGCGDGKVSGGCHNVQENGQSTVYTWIMSTGWWKNRAPVNPDAVFVVGFLCTCLIGGFIYLNRVKPLKSTRIQSYKSLKLVLIIASLYCVWCGSQIYMVNPRRPAVGEEADLGVLVFLATYFFLPHWFCIMSMNPKDHNLEQLPV